MSEIITIVAGILIFVLSATATCADTLLLKNGSQVDGIITNEQPQGVSINIGGGEINFTKDELFSVTHSTAEENEAIYIKWEKKKKRLETEDAAAKKARQAAMDQWREDYTKQQELRKKQEEDSRRLDAATKSVDVTISQGHIWVNAQLNNTIPANLVVDTGAPTVLLTAKFIEQLQLLPKDMLRIGTVSVLNGDHRAASILLRSLRIGDIEETNVPAMILLEPNKNVDKGFNDGLLGLSFLSRFHLGIDQVNSRLLLRKESGKENVGL